MFCGFPLSRLLIQVMSSDFEFSIFLYFKFFQFIINYKMRFIVFVLLVLLTVQVKISFDTNCGCEIFVEKDC